MGNRIETQDKLIAAARKIIIDEGVEAANVERICKVAGFSRGAFYSNFSSKDSLLAAMAEDEYAAMIDRLRARVEEWAARTELSPTGVPIIEHLLFEAINAIGVDKALYVLHSELLMRSIRDPEWGARLLEINVEFADELGNMLEWILTAAGRHLIRPKRAMTHSVIGIVMRAAGIGAWREATRGLSEAHNAPTAQTETPNPSEHSLANQHRGEGALAGGSSASTYSNSAAELLEFVLLVLYASSEPTR